MGLLITLYLIATNVYASLDAPPSRGFSYVEVWIAFVQCNILIAIIEYLFILCLMRCDIKFTFCSEVTPSTSTYINQPNKTR